MRISIYKMFVTCGLFLLIVVNFVVVSGKEEWVLELKSTAKVEHANALAEKHGFNNYGKVLAANR